MEYHKSVLLKESIDSLEIKQGGVYIDTTLGHGGHTIEILKLGGVVYGIDQDQKNLDAATKRIEELGLSSNFHPIKSNFGNIKNIFKDEIKEKVDGIIADLGLSSDQQKSQNRGFSFNDESSLDMRIDPENQEISAEHIINTYSLDQLYEIFTKLAQERYSKPLILKIIRARQKAPIKSGVVLASIIRKYYDEHNIRTKIDPSTKIFMALRITVNDEYLNIETLLNTSMDIVKKNGIVSIISFHSGEDRIIKAFIKNSETNKLVKSNFKAKAPTYLETKNNPLSRSAILRSYRII